MKIAYLIMTHADAEHLHRMVDALDYKADFFIHVDLKADIEPFKKGLTQSNIHFIENRYWCAWSAPSTADAEIALIRAALKSPEDYSHLIVLSGQDYPIKPKEDIYDFFMNNKGRLFMNLLDMRESPDLYLRHVKWKWFKQPLIRTRNNKLDFLDRGIRKALQLLRLPNTWAPSIIPYFGSTWVVLTSESANYVLKYVDAHPEFRKMNYYTFCPDEHFLHTIVGNSPFVKNVTAIKPFTGRGTYKMANLHIIHPSLTKWYTEDDWDEIIEDNSSEKLYIRKVRSADGSSLLNRIDMKLLSKRKIAI